ncbi:ExbD/TolR family protein [Mariniblastus fucicola]|uniref:Biopolymer transport protein ExbD/TolR n=1 Tax=Mariniblastus fucicola TaxID=980251 RepID=A0A5B9PE80_9BACT|nr:biopolymer transporter ExbD [Mariniblastus fucicola]QEG24718.1 Biopolymer transport protein ExbD/TolR [Mariniblastus fucicola]
MKFKNKKDTEILEGDLTPMIDMTFQLIAFFMLLINFSEVDRAEEITLPKSVLATPPVERPKYQVILNLDPDGEVVFAGNGYDISTLSPVLNQEINNAGRSRDRVPAKDIAVIIRAHEDTPTGTVQRLIAKCQEEEMENFKFRVKDEAYK